MPVIDITPDLEAHTLTITADYACPVQRLWDVYADPRQLEKVWGPEEFPATVVEHDLAPGGRVTYYMTGPEGERHHGYWNVLAAEEPTSFTFEDGFADADFTPDPDLPTSTCVATFTAQDGGTRAVYVTRYPGREALQTVLDMGVEEGTRSAMDQIDGVIAGS